ncbi:multiple coagulation factor deficiency protein 2 like protein [Ditylenchus destructor]|uniref:Multiple coagulation factor deficiency protein 2 like protein n=1 Tax=Ditylenchus destructor TaxID=166010 RepID=A0AAD4R8D5_9BILA|nr:multiple coagulation factor deficiency protein 2 like protein [Ditylenchus destructor]
MSRICPLLLTLSLLFIYTDADFGEKSDLDSVHLKQHLDDQIEVENREWSQDESRFHYFSLSDLNKDNVVDGVEIVKAVIHNHGDDHAAKIWSDDEIEKEVDKILKDADSNSDGSIDYGEYSKHLDL